MSRNPGLLFICNSLGIGGAEAHVVSLLNRLDTARFRLNLAYLKPDARLLPQLQATRLEGVHCMEVGSRIDVRAVRRLAALIDEQQIDLLVCTNNYSMLYGFLARRRARRAVRIIEVFHTTQLHSLKERMQSLLYRHLFARCDLLIFVCRNQMLHWQREGVGCRRQSVIHNGIDTDHYQDRSSPGEKTTLRARFGFGADDYLVGLCASFRPEKAHGDLLEALQRLRRTNPRARALLIGDGAGRPTIEHRIQALGLRDSVGITGFQADVRPFVSACDVMVLTSHAIETFSLSALESMSMGKPLVLSRIGGADEQVEDGVNGFLFQPGDIETLARHLCTLADPALRHRMGIQAQEIARTRFHVTGMVRAFEAEFSSVLATRDGSND